MKEKGELRSVFKKLRLSLSFIQRIQYNDIIRGKVLSLPEYDDISTIYTYITHDSEVDTVPIILQALSDGKKVAVPKVIGDEMEFYQIHSMDECKIGAYGILEPSTKNMVTPKKNEKIFMIVPGLAFDHSMSRIGYGKAYYDRYFHKYGEDNFYRLALAYDLQVVRELPSTNEDVKMNEIITEYRTYS